MSKNKNEIIMEKMQKNLSELIEKKDKTELEKILIQPFELKKPEQIEE